jgi:hypothetical protein
VSIEGQPIEAEPEQPTSTAVWFLEEAGYGALVGEPIEITREDGSTRVLDTAESFLDPEVCGPHATAALEGLRQRAEGDVESDPEFEEDFAAVKLMAEAWYGPPPEA